MPNDKPLIILIDDDETLIDMYSTKLGLSGFNVLTASNGREGFDLVLANTPNLVLTDLVMPESDGFELLRRIKNDKKTKDFATVALTNLSSESDKKEALKLGAIDYLVKSNYTPAQIVEKVRGYLGMS